MKHDDDGGPAFPNFVERGQWNDERQLYVPQMMAIDGMSLRDWFAGMALQGILASYANEGNICSPEASAKEAYNRADTMLAARKGEQ